LNLASAITLDSSDGGLLQSNIKNICAQSFCLFVLTINRMLASTVFKKTKGTGFAYNKALKITPFGRSDAFTRGGFAIMPHATAPLSLKL